MAKELEEMLRKFALSKKEVSDRWGRHVLQELAECKMSIIGKVMGEKIAHIVGIKSFVNNMWGFAKNIKVIEIGMNMFQIVFANLHDRDRVLSGKPWIYDNLPFVVLP